MFRFLSIMDHTRPTIAQVIIQQLRNVPSLGLLQIIAECIRILTWRHEMEELNARPLPPRDEVDSDDFSSEHWSE